MRCHSIKQGVKAVSSLMPDSPKPDAKSPKQKSPCTFCPRYIKRDSKMPDNNMPLFYHKSAYVKIKHQIQKYKLRN